MGKFIMSSNTAKQPRRSKAGSNASTQSDLNRIEAAGKVWWSDLPNVTMICLQIILIPFKTLSMAADFAVAMVFLAVILTVALWWNGYIPDQLVSDTMNELGTRVLSIIERSELL